MKRKKRIRHEDWVRSWTMRFAIGMVNDHIGVSSHDEYLTSREVDYKLTARSGKLTGPDKLKLGKLGRKCNH